MKLAEIINGLSELYRKERASLAEMNKELFDVSKQLAEAAMTNGQYITLKKHRELEVQRDNLIASVEAQEHFCDGMEVAREYLMNICFETEVS